MTKVVFENATIQDVIGKAAKIAPRRGEALDKAAGLMMEVDPSTGEVMVRTTNNEIFYAEVIDAVQVEGEQRTWLFPSAIMQALAAKIPIGSGKTIEFEDAETTRQVAIASGRMRARVTLISHEYYPTWEPFDPGLLSMVSGFGDRIQSVDWAAGDMQPLNGVRLDGNFVMATDRFRIAMIPLNAPPIYRPVTIPTFIVQALSKNLADVRIGLDGGRLLLMPDESTQIATVTYDLKYPDLPAMFKRDEQCSVVFDKTEFANAVDRTTVFAGNDRDAPLLHVIIGKEEIAVMIAHAEDGQLGDVVEVPGYAMHDRCTIYFTPKNLLDGVRAAPDNQVTLFYNLNEPRKPVRIDGGSGYEVLVMPRVIDKPQQKG